jgi:aerobic-type carbon monoxide dehydrogenase small subunit (CoxS/CutS family)
MSLTIRLRLNGREETLTVRPDETLQSVLRGRCGLSSVRLTCGIGLCGVCTVLLDGQPVSSCLVLAPLAAGREILTVEGLPADDPVLRAFVAGNAFQCGYCTPGFVLSARALLRAHPLPDRALIRQYLAGNLCRCGSYYAIEEAVLLAARLAAGEPPAARPPGSESPARLTDHR